ncbi:MAG: recombinase family protein [Candidatus Margulisbacteria bacterium]|nr:recombinase family protein [Candidatus Margulisiibacteriota bacterium]
MRKKAVIYCRVSSEKQVRGGNGLKRQEKRCCDYAIFNKWNVVAVFHDEGISGGLVDRPGIQKLLDFLDRSEENIIVLVDDINRWARDVSAHFALKRAIETAGGELHSTTMKFENSPEGHFIETIMAAGAELERNKNKRQVKHRMKSRLELGYWVFDSPPGYVYKKHPIHGKILVKDEPAASILKEALEGFSNNRFISQTDVKGFLDSKGFRARSRSKAVHLETVKRFLVQPLYSGVIIYEKWGIPVRSGKHEPIISQETYDKIQDKLKGKVKAFRKDLNEDFPLRGFILCTGCDCAMTASWSRSRNGEKHPYYRCKTKACKFGNKSVQRKRLETAFSKLLQQVTPQKQILDLLGVIALDVYNQKFEAHRTSLSVKENEVNNIQNQIKKLVEKLTKTDSESVAKAIESSIEEKEHDKQKLLKELAQKKNHDYNFETALEKVTNFISQPHNMWANGNLEQKQKVQKLVFLEPLTYGKETGFGTAKKALPFAYFNENVKTKSHLVEVTGVEPVSEKALN